VAAFLSVRVTESGEAIEKVGVEYNRKQDRVTIE
jgi:hypothetical protein